MDSGFSRRDFLRLAGAAGLLLGACSPSTSATPTAAPAPAQKPAPTARVISRVETEKAANQNLVDFVAIESIYMDAWAKAGYIDKLPTELLQRVPEKWR